MELFQRALRITVRPGSGDRHFADIGSEDCSGILEPCSARKSINIMAIEYTPRPVEQPGTRS